jgi:hypothetical protein
MKTLFDSDVKCYGGGYLSTYAIKDGKVYIWEEDHWGLLPSTKWIAATVSRFSSCEVPDELRSKLEAS